MHQPANVSSLRAFLSRKQANWLIFNITPGLNQMNRFALRTEHLVCYYELVAI